MADPDQVWVEACRKGDREAFGRLIEKYRERIINVAYSVLRDRDEAMDVSQEAFLRVHQRLGGFRGKSSFYTWLYRLTVNLAIDRQRKRKRRPAESLESIQERAREDQDSIFPDRKPGPREIASDMELAERINQAIDRLPPKHRKVILLREVQGLSYQEVADIVGCSLGTVMSRLHYARENLRKTLGPYIGRRFDEGGRIDD